MLKKQLKSGDFDIDFCINNVERSISEMVLEVDNQTAIRSRGYVEIVKAEDYWGLTLQPILRWCWTMNFKLNEMGLEHVTWVLTNLLSLLKVLRPLVKQ